MLASGNSSKCIGEKHCMISDIKSLKSVKLWPSNLKIFPHRTQLCPEHARAHKKLQNDCPS
jgi:hypothetical protein